MWIWTRSRSRVSFSFSIVCFACQNKLQLLVNYTHINYNAHNDISRKNPKNNNNNSNSKLQRRLAVKAKPTNQPTDSTNHNKSHFYFVAVWYGIFLRAGLLNFLHPVDLWTPCLKKCTVNYFKIKGFKIHQVSPTPSKWFLRELRLLT